MEILLNSGKNIKSTNSDLFNKIELNAKVAPMLEYEINNVLSSTEIFDNERENNSIYRIYGNIEYLSMLNGLKNKDILLEDYFKKNSDLTISTKTLLNSFDFYIVRPYNYVKFQESNTQYVRYFEVIATPNDFELFPAGFTNNIFGEQAYAFNCVKDFDVSNYFDSLGFPVTELFLYAKYKPQSISYTVGGSKNESLNQTVWNINLGSNSSYIGALSSPTTPILINGSIVYGDVIEYGKTEFLIDNLIDQTYYIITSYSSNVNDNVSWKYNPFIPLRLRYFGNEVYRENINSSLYEISSTIPSYATLIDNAGNYVWRRILPQGYTDPISGDAVDYPFVNKKRYLFSNITLSVETDLTNNYVMRNLKFSEPSPINSIPSTDLNSFNKPC